MTVQFLTTMCFRQACSTCALVALILIIIPIHTIPAGYQPKMSITLYEHADYKGRKLTLTESTPNLVRKRFNDIASSVVVAKGTWKLWEHVDYQGKSFIVTPGKYNIGEIHDKIGNDVISSVELCEEGKQ